MFNRHGDQAASVYIFEDMRSILGGNIALFNPLARSAFMYRVDPFAVYQSMESAWCMNAAPYSPELHSCTLTINSKHIKALCGP